MRFLSAPAIARLTATRPRMTTCDRMRRGKYGLLLRHGRTPYAGIAAVEAFHGVKFTEQQISLAIDGKPDRLLVTPDNQEEA